MDKGKIKNIIILILLLVNGFLAALTVADSAQSRAYEADAENSLMQVLLNSGIEVPDRGVLDIKAVPACLATRDLTEEKRHVSAAIGSAESQDLGGNIVMYYGKNGQACFRGTGDFEVLMENNTVATGSDPAETSRDFLKKLGLSMDSKSVAVKYGTGGASCVVTALCSYEDRPIMNCSVTLNFSETNLLLVTGTCPLTKVGENAGGGVIDTATAVMRFLEIMDENGYVCREITDISHCYKLDVAASGVGTLTPLWHFSTDVGDFYVNGVTGKTETVTQNN